MQSTDALMEGVGKGIANSPGWMVVIAVFIIGVLIIIAKYVLPSRERIKMRELEIREREAMNEAENIKVRAGMNEQLSGLRASNDNLAQQSAMLAAGIEESKVRSREMGGDLHLVRDDSVHIRETTDRTAEQVDEIHKHLLREITD